MERKLIKASPVEGLFESHRRVENLNYFNLLLMKFLNGPSESKLRLGFRSSEQ